MTTLPKLGSNPEPSPHAWLSAWEIPYEGPMSLVLKFGWANHLTANNLCEAIFGRVLLQSFSSSLASRSLLAPKWTCNNAPHAAKFVEKLLNAGLDHYTPTWYYRIASDRALRYCPTCLQHGYQSVLFQIDALAYCPIHGERILSHCSHCEAPTAPYTVSNEALSSPFHCTVCSQPIAGTFSPLIWTAPKLRQRAASTLAPLALWLQKLEQSSLQWWEWQEWFGDWFDDQRAVEKRLATFNVLTRVLPLELPEKFLTRPQRQLRIVAGTLYSEIDKPGWRRGGPLFLPEAQLRSRQSIYKSIRRRALKALPGCSPTSWNFSRKVDNLLWKGRQLTLSLDQCPKVQAVALWRLHFEEVNFLYALRHKERALQLRLAAVNWPWTNGVDDTFWAAYVWASLHACIEAISDWRKRAEMRPAKSGGIDSKLFANDLAMNFGDVLDPKWAPVMPRITMVIESSKAYTQPRHLFLIGPDAGTSAPLTLPLHPRYSRTDNAEFHQTHYRIPTNDTIPFQADGQQQNRKNAEPCESVQLKQVEPILPLERLALSPLLDGSNGSCRQLNLSCSINAKNDLEAIALWLKGFGGNTQRTYQQQIERCFLWAIHERNKPLSSLHRNDAIEYANFLLNPKPAHRWIQSTNKTRTEEGWAPFRRPYSATSRDNAIKVLSVFFNWLQNHFYVQSNPWSALPFGSIGNTRKDHAPAAAVRLHHRTLDCLEWEYVAAVLEKMPANKEGLQVKAVFYLAYFGGVQPGELVRLTLGSIRCNKTDAWETSIWHMTILGRSKEYAGIYVLPPAREAVSAFLRWRGLSIDGALASANISLLLDKDTIGDDIATLASDRSMLLGIAKKVFALAAQQAQTDGHTKAARRLSMATLTWLDDAFALHLLERSIGGNWGWALLGAHKSIPATMLAYLPTRKKLPAALIHRAFRKLEPMWKSRPVK